MNAAAPRSSWEYSTFHWPDCLRVELCKTRNDAALSPPDQASHASYPFLNVAADSMSLSLLTDAATRLRKIARHLIVLGIGGSSLGGRALIESVTHSHVVTFLEAPDALHLHSVLAQFSPQDVAIHLVSKSGQTLETLAQWSVIEAWMDASLTADEKRSRVVVTTDATGGLLAELARRQGFLHLHLPSEIGGRFSVFTSVGLFPLAFAGIDLARIVTGIDRALSEAKASPQMIDAIARHWVNRHLTHRQNILTIWAYSDELVSLSRWFQQLWAESLGKARHTDGTIAHVGSTPLACVGPQDQHSLLQLFMEGPRDKHFVIVAPQKLPIDLHTNDHFLLRQKLPTVELGNLMYAQARATCAALRSVGRACDFVTLPHLDAVSVSALMALFMQVTVRAAEIYQVNAFDQPGVELGKRLALGLLGHSDHTAEIAHYLDYLPA